MIFLRNTAGMVLVLISLTSAGLFSYVKIDTQYELSNLTSSNIQEGERCCEEALTAKNPLFLYEEALERFEIAYELQKKAKEDISYIQQKIQETEKIILLLRLEKKSSSYLPNSESIKKFEDTVNMCAANVIDGFEQLLTVRNKQSPHQFLMFAVIQEEKKEYLLAMEDYLRLSEDNPKALACIEKAYELLTQACESDQSLFLRKDGIRLAFEKQLALLSQNSPQEQAPTCFICFNVDEKDVGLWLEKILVPDLDKAGIKPIFCFRGLSLGQDLAPFQQLSRNADIVMCVFTPDVKKKYQERQKAPTGIAQEIRIIQERFNDEDKFNKIFPIYLKGSRSEVNPTPYFEPLFGSKFSLFEGKTEPFEFNYFSNAFDLLFAMRGLSREESRGSREFFVQEAKKILRGDFDQEEVKKWRTEKETKLQALKDSIEHRVTASTQIVNLPLFPDNFTGRKQELETLHEACSHKYRVAITGLGGMGKTALALKYGNDYKTHYQFIHFISAGTSELIIDGLLKLADDLHIPKTEKVDDRLSWLKTALNKLEKEVLIVFDGIDQEEAFRTLDKYLPERGHCLLLTSRMPEQAKKRGFHSIELESLKLEDAISFLLQTTGSHDREAAKKLAQELGRLPLALTHAASYICSQKIKIQTYCDLFKKHQLKLFEDKELTLLPGEKTILATWEISMRAIAETDVGALSQEILNMFAFLAQAPIPFSLVEAWLQKNYPHSSELGLRRALRLLCDYSMLSGANDVYNIHTLMQKVTRYKLSDKKRVKIHEELTLLFLDMADKWDFDNEENWEKCKKEISEWKGHIETWKEDSLFETVSEEYKRKINFKIGFFYLEIGNYKKALEIFEPEKNFSKDLEFAQFLDASSRCYYLLGQYDEALKEEFKALKVWEDSLGKENYHVAQASNLIGLCYIKKKETELARENYLYKALAIRTNAFGRDDHRTAMVINNIGASFTEEEKYEKALEQYEEAYKIWSKKSHRPKIIMALTNIGDCYEKLKKYEKALEHLSEALQIAEESIGFNHPYVASILNNIGECCIGQKKYKEALERLQRAQKLCEEFLGPDNDLSKKILENIQRTSGTN